MTAFIQIPTEPVELQTLTLRWRLAAARSTRARIVLERIRSEFWRTPCERSEPLWQRLQLATCLNNHFFQMENSAWREYRLVQAPWAEAMNAAFRQTETYQMTGGAL